MLQKKESIWKAQKEQEVRKEGSKEQWAGYK